jgi:hypothetical protein
MESSATHLQNLKKFIDIFSHIFTSEEKCIEGLVRICEGNRPLGRLRKRQNINAHVREVGQEAQDWTILAQDGHKWQALVKTVINLRIL